MPEIDHRKKLGARSEEIAADWVEGKGFCILNKNFTTRFGEIDIIAERDDVVYFIEVRSSHSSSEGRLIPESISRKKLHRLYSVGQTYLQRKNLLDRAYVFTLMIVRWINEDEFKVTLVPIE